MSNIIGPSAAKAALNQLIARIKTSLAAAGPAAYGAAVDAAQIDLEAFWKSTLPSDFADPVEVAAVRAVDEVARDLFIELSLDEMEANMVRLEQGATKLETLGGSLASATSTNVRSAASIGLQPVKDALDSMTTMVNSVKALKANLSSAKPDEAKVIAEIEKLAAQFEALKTLVTAA